jgi:hypothetical protein
MCVGALVWETHHRIACSMLDTLCCMLAPRSNARYSVLHACSMLQCLVLCVLCLILRAPRLLDASCLILCAPCLFLAPMLDTSCSMIDTPRSMPNTLCYVLAPCFMLTPCSILNTACSFLGTQCSMLTPSWTWWGHAVLPATYTFYLFKGWATPDYLQPQPPVVVTCCIIATTHVT